MVMEPFGVEHEEASQMNKGILSSNEKTPAEHVLWTESEWSESHHDAADMARLGKKQEFKVRKVALIINSHMLTPDREISISYLQ